MILSLVLWACANKSLSETEEADDKARPYDAKTGVMVSEMNTVSVAEVRMPVGQAISRECFGRSTAYRNRSSTSPSAVGSSSQGQYYSGPTGGSGMASGRSAASPTTASAPPPAVAAQPAPPAPTAKPSAVAQNSGATRSYGAADAVSAPQSSAEGNAWYAPVKSVAEAAPAPDSRPLARTETKAKKASEPANVPAERSAPSGVATLGYLDDGTSSLGGKGSSPKLEARRDAPADKEKSGGERQKDRGMTAGMDESDLRKADGDIPYGREQAEEERLSNLDWGATTYLSNDDSMSLASAQRLLWAIQNRGPVATSQIRPHEFLNYFSFDTAPVQGHDTFSVLASAEQTEPGKMTMALAVKGATPERKPLDVTLVLDRSGSMSAEGRMEYLKRGLTKMTDQLERGDRVDVVLFDDKLCTPLEDYVVGRDDPELLADVISSLQPRGSTNLDIGLKEGYKIANARPLETDRSQRMILISDALLNEGELDVNMVSDIGKSYDSRGIRLSAVGVGRDFNDKVLDMLSEKGKGAYVYLGSEAVVDRIFGEGFNSLTQTIAGDVHFALDLPDSLAIERFYGEESSTNKADVQAINYYAGTTQLFLQDLAMSSTAPSYEDPVTLTVEWTDVDNGAARKQTFRSSVGRLLRSDNRNLHKGQALMAWTDLVMERSMGGDPCGAPYAKWSDGVQTLGDDAEIAWLDGLTSPLCGQRPATTQKLVSQSSVPYKIKVDSDQVIAEVGMQCGSRQRSVSLSGNVARFDVAPGDCQLVLYGNVPLYAQVEVPQTGGDVRCVVRGGRMSCT